ncbi:hypothetical protein DOY81_000511, partial [Sarcophaga bullata]
MLGRCVSYQGSCENIADYAKIYTDWANYYLERSKSKKKVTDLSADCRDGLLLAEVIEAVTSFKVPDLHKKPKNQQQMYDNVNSCLNVLRSQTVSGLDNITTNDICCGRLKAVLALFFALSRFKQQSKQSKCNNATAGLSIKAEIHQQPNTTTHQQQQQHQQIPQAYTKANGTAIPLPATVMVQRRCPPDKVRPLPPTPNHTPSIPGLGKSGSDFNSSRPNSPPSSNHSVQSLKSGNNNGLRPPSAKTGIPAPGTNIAPPTVTTQQKHSMLDKLKLFNKEKSSAQQQQQQLHQHQQTHLQQTHKNQMQSKRTSSSSGFSSARSERSDSSLSLNDGHISQIKPPTVTLSSAANKNRADNKTKQSSLLKQQNKKDQVKSTTKLDKKEKSPARSLSKEDSNLDSKTSTLNRSKNSLTRTGLSNDKTKTSSRSSLTHKSESKTSLIMPPSKTLNSPNGTALPKPIAAIKGTSKQLQPSMEHKKTRLAQSNSNQDLVVKREKSDISNASAQTQTLAAHNISASGSSAPIPPPPTHIVKPVNISTTEHKTPYYANTTASTNHLQNEAMYSRLPPPKTTGLLNTPCSMRKLEYNSGPGVLQPQQHSPLKTLSVPSNHHSQPVTPTQQPQPGLNESALNKFHTIPSKIVGTIYEEDKPLNVQPMRPLLRGYNSHVTLPTRGARGTHHFVSDFCDNELNQGYCSDGDSLRFSNSRPLPGGPTGRYHDIDNGYLSEGSSGIGLQQNGHASHGKHFLSMMRARTQLPTTIEERIRNSRGSLDSIGTAAASSVASQASSSGGSNPKMDMTNGLNGSGNNSSQNSPQHHHSSPSHRSSSRNGRDNWSKMPEPLNGQKSEHKEKSSPSRRSLSGSNSKQGSPSSSRSKSGVPPSFGYVKRANGCNTATAEQQNITMMMNANNNGGNSPQNGRTAHVSAVPRTSSGGQMHPNPQHRSYSLTGPGATQLSQCIRERLAGSHSLPKPGSDMHVFQHRLSSNRPGKMLDGSLSDTQTYAEVKPEYSSYAMWLKHSNTAGSRLSEGDSLENMQLGSPSMSRHNHKMMQHRAAAAAAVAAANAAAANTNNIAGSESPYVQSPRLNRSNSIRSTKSEKMYPSMLSRGADVEIEPYYCLPVGAQHNGVISAQMAAAAAAANAQVAGQQPTNNSIAWSQPTSPTPINRGFGGPMSPTHANTMPGMQVGATGSTASHRLTYPKKNDEVHGSTASLLSGGSSLYGTSEERQAQEIRRLKRELMEAREQVLSLSGQLSTN